MSAAISESSISSQVASSTPNATAARRCLGPAPPERASRSRSRAIRPATGAGRSRRGDARSGAVLGASGSVNGGDGPLGGVARRRRIVADSRDVRRPASWRRRPVRHGPRTARKADQPSATSDRTTAMTTTHSRDSTSRVFHASQASTQPNLSSAVSRGAGSSGGSSSRRAATPNPPDTPMATTSPDRAEGHQEDQRGRRPEEDRGHAHSFFRRRCLR